MAMGGSDGDLATQQLIFQKMQQILLQLQQLNANQQHPQIADPDQRDFGRNLYPEDVEPNLRQEGFGIAVYSSTVLHGDDSSEEDEDVPMQDPAHGRQFNDRRVEDCQQFRDFRPKMELSLFGGSFHFEAFLDWLLEVDRYFDCLEVPAEKQVRL